MKQELQCVCSCLRYKTGFTFKSIKSAKRAAEKHVTSVGTHQVSINLFGLDTRQNPVLVIDKKYGACVVVDEDADINSGDYDYMGRA
jgi:hypothetical protein